MTKYEVDLVVTVEADNEEKAEFAIADFFEASRTPFPYEVVAVLEQ